MSAEVVDARRRRRRHRPAHAWEHVKDAALFPLARSLLEEYRRAHPADPDMQRADKVPSCDEFFAYVCRKLRASDWGLALPGAPQDKLRALAASLLKIKPLDYSGKHNPAYRWKAAASPEDVYGAGERNMAEWVFRDAFPGFKPPPTPGAGRQRRQRSPAPSPSPRAATSGDAADEWEPHTSEHGRVFFTNKRTMKSVWDTPPTPPTAEPAVSPTTATTEPAAATATATAEPTGTATATATTATATATEPAAEPAVPAAEPAVPANPAATDDRVDEWRAFQSAVLKEMQNAMHAINTVLTVLSPALNAVSNDPASNPPGP